MLMLAVYRKLSWHHGNVITGKWRVGDFASNRTYELEGKTLGIVGPRHHRQEGRAPGRRAST